MGMNAIIVTPPTPLEAFVDIIDRDAGVASGDQVLVGLGFEPRGFAFNMCVGSAAKASFGFATLAADGSIVDRHLIGADTWATEAFGIFMYQTGAIYYTGEVTAVGADGFTISWVRTGAAAGAMAIKALCLG